MLNIKGVSESCCFICGSKEKTLDVNIGKVFKGTLCLTHVWEKLKPEEAPRVTVPKSA